jgi:hypothetical protein
VAGTEIVVVGMDVEDVGAAVVVVSSGCVVVVCVGWVVAGAVVPGFDGAVVATGARVVAVPPAGAAVVLVLAPTAVDEVELDVDGAADDVVVGRTVVVGPLVEVEPWLATCWRGEVSSPVATSKRRAARAIVARA